jgi:type IV pilus assembly protein PilN
VAAAAGAVVVGIWYSLLQQLTSSQQDRNNFLKSEIAKLEAQIKDIANLRNEIEALKARQRAVEDLQTNRNIPVYLLDELVKQTPEGIYLTSIKQNGGVVTVAGIAQTNERVSEFLRNAQYNSKWLERPELVEIKAVTMTTTNKEQRRLFDFSMRVTMKRPALPAPRRRPAPAPWPSRHEEVTHGYPFTPTQFRRHDAARSCGIAVPRAQRA